MENNKKNTENVFPKWKRCQWLVEWRTWKWICYFSSLSSCRLFSLICTFTTIPSIWCFFSFYFVQNLLSFIIVVITPFTWLRAHHSISSIKIMTIHLISFCFKPRHKRAHTHQDSFNKHINNNDNRNCKIVHSLWVILVRLHFYLNWKWSFGIFACVRCHHWFVRRRSNRKQPLKIIWHVKNFCPILFFHSFNE